jgi:hypothetical protein
LTPDEAQCLAVLFGILDNNVDDKFNLTMLLGKIRGLLVVATLPAHGDGCLQIEFEIARRLDELFQLIDILELCIAVKKQCCVV